MDHGEDSAARMEQRRRLNCTDFCIIALMLIRWDPLWGQTSNVTVPIPGATIPNDEFGKPQLFFDARTTGFTRNGKQQIFDGDVIAIGAKSIITADKVIVDQESRQLIAEGHVVILAADQILTGDKIEFLLESGDFRIQGARMIVNDKVRFDRIAKDVLGFSAQELSFEAERKLQIQKLSQSKDQLRQEVRRKVKLGQDASEKDLRDFARYLEQEDLINGQENPAFAHMTEARRNTLRKRRDFWEQSRVADRVQGDPAKQSFFRLEGDELIRENGNDFRARHSLWTPCHCEPSEKPAWGIRAATTEAQMGGYATFYDALIEIKGIPVLYVPWLKIPIKDRRQSGLLMPSFTDDAISGSGFSQPLFIDMGRDKDATLKADMFERRGMRLGGEFRWKRREYSGMHLNVEGMRDRLWLKQRANRRDLSGMYKDGLAAARQDPPGQIPGDSSDFIGREYTRQRLSERQWWEQNAPECLSENAAERDRCENYFASTTRTPSNVNRGMAKWRVYDRLGERTAFVTTGEIYSDRQYNDDLYIPESMQPGFDSGSGERAINPVNSRLTYDGREYFLGLGSFWGDPSRLDDRFEGYQMPLTARAQSRWYQVKKDGAPIYMRGLADHIRVTREAGSSEDEEFQKRWLPSGSWKRAELSLLAPLTNRSALQIDHFTDFEGRIMSFDGRSSKDGLNRDSSLSTWRTGFRLQLPIDGKSRLPQWLGGYADETGQRMIQHVMNWSMTIAARPTVFRRGPYGEENTKFASSPRTWFATDQAGSDDHISPMDYMSEYQLITFATSHRWKLFNEIWQTTPGEKSPVHQDEFAKLSYEEKARRELLYTMDRPVRSDSDIFSSDQTRWFTNRYQLLETDYMEPVSLGASISYDRLKDVKRSKEGRTRDNRPWSDTDANFGLSFSGWSFAAASKYNIYDKSQTKLTTTLIPPSFARSNMSLAYTIERSPFTSQQGGLAFTATKEKSVTVVTSMIYPLTTSWSYSRKDKENEAPATDYRQKLSIVYGSDTGCWGIGFAREKGYGVDENTASYLLQLNVTFMGQTRDLPNMSSTLERELKKS
jgi:hypothetical protein